MDNNKTIKQEILDELKQRIQPIEKDIHKISKEKEMFNNISGFAVSAILICSYSIGARQFTSAIILWLFILSFNILLWDFKRRATNKLKYINIVINKQVKFEKR